MRYLLYKDYASGLFNNWISFELGAGLAHLTNRRMVLYGSVGEEKKLLHIRGGNYQYLRPGFSKVLDNRKHPTLLDLMEQSAVELLDYPTYCSEAKGVATLESDIKLTRAAFVHGAQTASDALEKHGELLEEFLAGREILVDPAQPTWHLHACNLGYYSRFFFSPPSDLRVLMRRIRPRSEYSALARRVSGALGPFNGVHMRLTDFKKFLPQGDDYAATVIETLSSIFARDDLLVICTDESHNREFFAPIIKAFPKHVFLDEFIVSNFADEFKLLPFTDEQSLGFVCNIVMWDAREFAGTPGSTYSGMIHRHWYINRRERAPSENPPFRFINCGEAGKPSMEPGYFENGAFVERRAGQYSWSRTSIRKTSEALSWYREWPEAALAPDFPADLSDTSDRSP
jgi:hypothetical protein